jgi:hypothetical protein
MVLLLDDRARQVEHNTGRVFCGHPREDLKAYRYAISGHRRKKNRRSKVASTRIVLGPASSDHSARQFSKDWRIGNEYECGVAKSRNARVWGDAHSISRSRRAL